MKRVVWCFAFFFKMADALFEFLDVLHEGVDSELAFFEPWFRGFV